MNYIRQLNAFYDWLETNPLNHQCIVLWHALMHTNSKAGWQKEFTVAVITLELKTGLNRRAIERARNKLEQLGLIRWRKRSGSQSAVYEMIPLTEKFVRQNDGDSVAQTDAQNVVRQNEVDFVAQSDVQRDVQSDAQTVVQSVAINKLNETEIDLFNTPPINNPPLKAKGEKKRKYADFVSMTEEEYQKLVDEYGEEFTRRCIEVLDNYKGAKGKKYKSDYRAIKNWVVGRVEEEMERKRAKEGRHEKYRRDDRRLFGDYNPDDFSL